jgi:NADPH:quinone reductase-like Zn-dependent oxidoreductase
MAAAVTGERTGQMNAIVLDRFGDVDELTSRSIPLPAVGANDVLIRVNFAGIGSWDRIEREGQYDGVFGIASSFPYVLGWDAAGTIAGVGSSVERFEIGDRVYVATMPVPRGGAYAEYAVVDAEHVASIPDKLPMREAGALPWDALTAQSGIELLDPHPGTKLMVFGASGGIGHLALQLALARGAHVLAVVSGEDGIALAERLGAHAIVDGKREDVGRAAKDFAPEGLDGALVTAGGPKAERALRAVKSSGMIVWPNGVNPMPSDSLKATVRHYDGDRRQSAMDRLNAIIAVGALRVHLAATYPVARVRDAHRALEEHYVGKMVLELAVGEV